MNEASTFTFIIILIGYLFAFICGYLLCKCRERGLGTDTDLHNQLSDTIKDSANRVDNLENGLGDIIETGRDIEEILRKYNDSVEEGKDLE